MEKSEQTTIDRSREGNGEDKKSEEESSKKIPWNIRPSEKGAYTRPGEVYDSENDRYIYKPAKRNKIKVQVSGIDPEISENFLKKIKKKIEEEYPGFVVPKKEVPVAIRFHLHLIYPGPKSRKKYAHAGYYYPSGVDLREWSDFVYEGLQGLLYTDKSQIVCCGAECMFSPVPGIVIEQFILWDMIDRINGKKETRYNRS